MKRVFLLVAILFIALVGNITAQTPATLPYSCDFSDATERSNWILRNTSDYTLARWFFQYDPNEYDYFLSCGNGSSWVYQPEGSPVTVYAFRKFICGDADSIKISFTYNVEGEGSHSDGMAYDYITTICIRDINDSLFSAKKYVDNDILRGTDGFYAWDMLFNHADGIPATHSDSVNACKLFMKNGTFTTTVKNPNPNDTAYLIFAWTNDSEGTNSGNNKSGWIDNISITPVVNYGITIAGVKVTSENCNNITDEYITGSVSYNPTTNTLTLDNATIDEEIYFGEGSSRIEDMTITLVGENSVEGVIGSVSGTKIINGTGSLKARWIDCSYEQNTIIEDCTIEIDAGKSAWALFSDNEGSKLTIKNANLYAQALEVAIGDFADIELIGCEIVEPVNAQIIDTTFYYYGDCVGKYICDADGNIAKKVVIKKLSGLNNIAQSSINIYPNPAHDNVTIEGKGEIKIINSLGQIVKEIKDNNVYRTLNIKDFERGVYYIKLGEITQKLVVE